MRALVDGESLCKELKTAAEEEEAAKADLETVRTIVLYPVDYPAYPVKFHLLLNITLFVCCRPDTATVLFYSLWLFAPPCPLLLGYSMCSVPGVVCPILGATMPPINHLLQHCSRAACELLLLLWLILDCDKHLHFVSIQAPNPPAIDVDVEQGAAVCTDHPPEAKSPVENAENRSYQHGRVPCGAPKERGQEAGPVWLDAGAIDVYQSLTQGTRRVSTMAINGYCHDGFLQPKRLRYVCCNVTGRRRQTHLAMMYHTAQLIFFLRGHGAFFRPIYPPLFPPPRTALDVSTPHGTQNLSECARVLVCVGRCDIAFTCLPPLFPIFPVIVFPLNVCTVFGCQRLVKRRISLGSTPRKCCDCNKSFSGPGSRATSPPGRHGQSLCRR